MENQISRFDWSRIHGLFEPFWYIGDLFLINYCIFGVITYLYFPLYVKQVIGENYNIAMLVFDGIITIILSVIGGLFVTMIIQGIIRVIKRCAQKKNK